MVSRQAKAKNPEESLPSPSSLLSTKSKRKVETTSFRKDQDNDALTPTSQSTESTSTEEYAKVLGYGSRDNVRSSIKTNSTDHQESGASLEELDSHSSWSSIDAPLHGPATESSRYPSSEVPIFIPTREEFRSHPPNLERSNAWWEKAYKGLYDEILDFSETYFGQHDISRSVHSPWDQDHSAELLVWADEVAEADDEDGSWESLLQDTRQRVNFIAAIVTRIVFMRVFLCDLWGAAEHEKALLQQLDHTLIDNEPYERTDLRLRIVHTILDGRTFPENFHPESALLATKIYTLLQPLTDYFYALPSHKARSPLPSILAHRQTLYNIVSHAAYLHICGQLSSSIFYAYFPRPGDKFAENLAHWNIDEEITSDSETVKLSIINEERLEVDAIWNTLNRELREIDDSSPRGAPKKQHMESDIATARAKYERACSEKLKLPTSVEDTHQKRIKIAVWPSLTRYSSGSGKKGPESEHGERDYSLMYSGSIFYWGRVGEMEMGPLGQYYEVRRPGVRAAEYWASRNADAMGSRRSVWREGWERYWIWWQVLRTALVCGLAIFLLGYLCKVYDGGL